MLEKIKELLDNASKVYYEGDGDPLLTDEEFDKVLNHYLKFADYKVVKKSGKKLVEVEHSFPELVGTLDKTNYIYAEDKPKKSNTDSAEEWFQRTGISPKKKLKVAVSEKKDGNSITLTYDSYGAVKNGLTRGTGGKGADVSEFFSERTLEIFKGEEFGVKYEAMLDDENFEKVSERIGKTFANSRSLTAGLISSLDGKIYSKFISLVPIRFQFKKRKITREEEFEFIDKINEKVSHKFPVIPYTYQIIKGNQAEILEQLAEIYEEYNSLREKLNHPIDGLVVEILNEDIREELGRRDDRNNFEFALKFPYLIKRSTLRDIEFYYGLSGRITPVAVFEPVEFNGAICTNVSLANYKRFKELKLSKGDSIFVEYRNDVLGYVTKDPNNKNQGKPIKFIKTCPECGEPLFTNKNRTFVYCKNTECPGRVLGKLVIWFEKLNIKGVKGSTLQTIVESGLVKSVPDLYWLTKKSLMEVAEFRDKSSSNIISAIESRKEIFDWELLGSLSFKNIGRKTCKLIFRGTTLDEVLDNFDEEGRIKKDSVLEDELLEIKGIEVITAKNFIKGVETNYKIIKELMNLLEVKSFKEELGKSSSKDVKKIVFTGFRNPAMQEALENKGHSVVGSVSKNTDMVIAKDISNMTGKLGKAKDLGIVVYSLADFEKNVFPKLVK